MNVLAVELSMRLFDSNSLKDKRSVVKSISSRVLCQQIVDKIIEEIESNYPVEIYQINEVE